VENVDGNMNGGEMEAKKSIEDNERGGRRGFAFRYKL